MHITKRIYNDFFRPSKEKDYEVILKTARDNGYEFHTLLSFETVIQERPKNGKKYLILRRDVDTADINILRKMLYMPKTRGPLPKRRTPNILSRQGFWAIRSCVVRYGCLMSRTIMSGIISTRSCRMRAHRGYSLFSLT